MNKSGIAMAADSAVTITAGRGGMKTYDTVNKLFELLRGSNVGVMVYNNAELNGVPWETIVKIYRQERHEQRFSHLEDYVDDFRGFVESSKSLIPPTSDERVVLDACYFQTLPIFQFLQANPSLWLTQKTNRPVQARLNKVVAAIVDDWERVYRDEVEVAAWDSRLGPKHLLAFKPRVVQFIDEQFANLNLAVRTRRRIVELCLDGLRRRLEDPTESGLVISGFGTEDYMPKLYSCKAHGRVNGVLRVDAEQSQAVTSDEPGFLSTFAQDEQAWGFLSGISGPVRQSVIQHWGEWSNGFPNKVEAIVKATVPKLSNSNVQRLGEAIGSEVGNEFERFLDVMQTRQNDEYIRPMLESVAVLPKDELGVLAESLVNLTSLKQRMSIYHTQTVGGPIDVALISPGDGFIWLNRKHYFSSELNPTWHLTHHAKI